MKSTKLCRITLLRFLVVLALISSFLVLPAYSQETEDSQIFISGFNAYQQKNYSTAIAKMDEVLQKYPDTPLRDMTLFWLARAHFKSGHRDEAARVMSQFTKEFPDSPLKGTVEEELLTLAAQYDKGVTSAAASPAPSADQQAQVQKDNAEQQRLAAVKAEEARLAAVAAENKRLAALKAEEERAAAEKAEQARLAAEKAEQQRLTAVKAEEARLAAVAAENKRLAALKAEEERAAAEKAEQARLAAEKAEQQRLAAVKAEEARLAAVAAENKRLAALKAEEERAAAEKAEQQCIAAAKAEQERIAAAEAEQTRLAALKAEQDRLAAEKAELERVAAVKAEQQRLAATKAEEARLAALAVENKRLAALKAEEERAAAEKAEQQRIAAAKAEQERIAAAEAEQTRLAALKAEQNRLAAEKAAGEAEAARQTAAAREQVRIAAAKADEQRRIDQRAAEDQATANKAALREKAIAQYKAVIQTYPTSKAAASAAAKLQEMGIAVAIPPQPAGETQPENAQVLRLEVAQFAGFEFKLLAAPQAYDVARRITVPFEITNRGNGSDSFYLESGFPAGFKAGFATLDAPDQAINQTPVLSPNETFKGSVTLAIPATSIDGLRIAYPVKAASRFMSEATQSREIHLTAAAPLLRAVLKADKTQPLPGEKIQYRVAVLNVGSTAAQNVSLRLNFPPQLEPVDYAAAGFTQEMKAALVRDGLQIKSGESKEFTVAFLVKDDSLAGQELLCRAELFNNQLKTGAAFVSNVANIKAIHGIQVLSASDRIVTIPGQTVTVPFVVTNIGNVREKFAIASSLTGAQDAIVFHDLNRDGIRQAGEPVISEVGPLEPKEEASIVMEIGTPRSAADTSEGSARITFSPEGDPARTGSGTTRLVYSRPVLQMAMTGRDGRLKPGEVASFDLAITNRGSNLARVVDLQSAWPEQLELVAAEPANSSAGNGNITWKFKELGAGEKRTIKVSFRVKPGTGVGTSLQVTNTLKYEDQLGNRY